MPHRGVFCSTRGWSRSQDHFLGHHKVSQFQTTRILFQDLNRRDVTKFSDLFDHRNCDWMQIVLLQVQPITLLPSEFKLLR